ncbi:MAG TPA: penicillin acylase family protein [Iamia sp.]|nr:penicillin acylase family protein [Iamia sp.]
MEGHGRYEADIRWTTHGVAHVRAADWGSLGFGQAWACARDHLGTLADQFVKVRSERARFHGPGPDGAHLASDLGYQALGLAARAVALRDAQGEEIRALVTGAVAGYNARLAEAVAEDRVPDWCRGAEWLRPIEELDLYAYLVDVTLLASGRALLGLIGRAEAPGPDGPVPPAPLDALGAPADGAGSNGWAFGRDATASGGGLVMGNPHFPWDGEARFWECHLTLHEPGAARPELDVYGCSLVGTPGVLIGFNPDVAWTHTVSRGHRFTLGRLDLVPGRPTAYRWGDEEREMEPATFTVEVRDAEPVERTLWRSHHGPMVNLPLLGWGLETAFTYRDANIDNTSVLAQWIDMGRARSIDDLQAAMATHQAVPWVNTLAADRTGRAWYIDASATPNLGEGAQRRFRERISSDLVAALLYENRVALVDGSDPDDDWIAVDGARSPGLVPHRRLPQIERTDVVSNANDSHWSTQPDAPLEGYSVLHGFERTPLSPRTRQNLRTTARLAEVGGVTNERALAALFANDVLTAELLAGAVVERIRGAGPVRVGDRDVDLRPAADVLDRWDRRDQLTSVGSALWREVLAGFAATDVVDAGPLWAVPFDADDPVETPRDLAEAPDEGPDPVLAAVAGAVLALEQAGVAIDAPLGEVQWATRGSHRVPVHGGVDREGVLNVLSPVTVMASTGVEPQPPRPAPVPGRAATSGLAEGGYPCRYGASFVFSVEMRPDGPVGVGLLAYGQSADPRSPHHVDGTRAYADQAVRPLLVTEDAIAAATEAHRTVTG